MWICFILKFVFLHKKIYEISYAKKVLYEFYCFYVLCSHFASLFLPIICPHAVDFFSFVKTVGACVCGLVFYWKCECNVCVRVLLFECKCVCVCMYVQHGRNLFQHKNGRLDLMKPQSLITLRHQRTDWGSSNKNECVERER